MLRQSSSGIWYVCKLAEVHGNGWPSMNIYTKSMIMMLVVKVEIAINWHKNQGYSMLPSGTTILDIFKRSTETTGSRTR